MDNKRDFDPVGDLELSGKLDIQPTLNQQFDIKEPATINVMPKILAPDSDLLPTIQQVSEAQKRTMWLPGQSGNPTGKNAGRPINHKELTKALQEYLHSSPERIPTLVKSLFELATTPNRAQLPALQEIYNRIDGRVPDKLEVQSLMVTATPDQLASAAAALDQAIANERALVAEFSSQESAQSTQLPDKPPIITDSNPS